MAKLHGAVEAHDGRNCQWCGEQFSRVHHHEGRKPRHVTRDFYYETCDVTSEYEEPK